VSISVHSWQAARLRHLSTNMFTHESYESGRQMSQPVIFRAVNGICFSRLHFYGLGAPFSPARLSQRYTQPFIARETISIQKLLRWLHCGTGEVKCGERGGVTSQLVQRCHSFNHCKLISFTSVIFRLAPVNFR